MTSWGTNLREAISKIPEVMDVLGQPALVAGVRGRRVNGGGNIP